MVKLFSPVIILFLFLNLHGQAGSYSYFYRISFTAKRSQLSDYKPAQLISERAIARRQREGVAIIDNSDIPVSTEDIRILTELGLTLHSTSRWMNSALMKSNSYIDPAEILKLPNIASVELVKKPVAKGIAAKKLEITFSDAGISQYDRPLSMLNGYALHDQDLKGSGILIAVLDGGFDNAEEIASLNELRERNGIKGTHDFVRNQNDVYNSSIHGTAVLSVLAGKLPYVIAGTAPDADFLLLTTEDVSSEFPCEEDYWTAGAEYADSSGADIINSSLGYATFDDPSFNYSFNDLDGRTSFVTKAAEIAASKGIIVVNSAGNERVKPWIRINCPADGKSVLATGAVDEQGKISAFSSAGPSSDRRIKPDIVALGVDVPVQTSDYFTGTVNGTSFSCPVISGITACLMQSVPKAKNTDIIKAIKESADRFQNPDSLYGYGLPDMGRALASLQDLYTSIPDEIFAMGPNPTTGEFEIIFREHNESIIIEIFNATGSLIWKYTNASFAGRTLKVDELVNREQGLYLVRIKTPAGASTEKIIKLKN